MVSLGLMVSLVSLQVPTTVAGVGHRFPTWDEIVPTAFWIASGTVSLSLGEGRYVVKARECLKGQAQLEVSIAADPSARPHIPVGTPIVVYGHPTGRVGYLLPAGFDRGAPPDWFEQVAITVRMRLRLEAAISNEERTQILREMLESGLEEPISAVRTFVIHYRDAANYRELWPDFIRAYRVGPSRNSEYHIVNSLLEIVAEPGDIKDLILLLGHGEPALQREIVFGIRRFTVNQPPPIERVRRAAENEPIDFQVVREELLEWFEANRGTRFNFSPRGR